MNRLIPKRAMGPIPMVNCGAPIYQTGTQNKFI
jgi:hypothetical protein